MNWKDQAAQSHYQTAAAVAEQLRAGNVEEAAAGLQELIEALARSDKRALKSQLARLMSHVLKWKTQPEQRSRGWRATIFDAREQIAEIQEETPSLTDDVIRSLWDKCLLAARRQAEAEMNQEVAVSSLTWDEVFNEAYGEE